MGAHLRRVAAERTGSVDTDDSESEGQGGMSQSNVVGMPPLWIPPGAPWPPQGTSIFAEFSHLLRCSSLVELSYVD